MATKKIKFTTVRIEKIALAKGTKRKIYWDAGCPNLGLSIGKRTRSYIFQGWIAGSKKQLRITIGAHGTPGPNGLWCPDAARLRCNELRKLTEAGIDPRKAVKKSTADITWADAIAMHRDSLKGRNKAAATIAAFSVDGPLGKFLGEFLHMPLARLSGSDLQKLYQRVLDTAVVRTNAVNKPGATAGARAVAQVKAVWNTVDRYEQLPGKCPKLPDTPDALDPKLLRIPHEGFGLWYETLMSEASPVIRDLNLFILFTGLRSASACALEWRDVDRAKLVLTIRVCKGGKVLKLPITETMLAILDRRRSENATAFPTGDSGIIFPRMHRGRVASLKHPKIYVATGKGKRTRHPMLINLHGLRCTFNSVAQEIRIHLEDREMLMGHSPSSMNARAYVASQTVDGLRDVAAKIEAALLSRLGLSEIYFSENPLGLVA